MQERHDILARTIGYLDEEQEALDTGYQLLIGSTVTMVVGSLFQILFFYLYNGRFHPFANILIDETEGKIKLEVFSSLLIWFKFFRFILEPSAPEQTGTSMANTDEVTGCDESTQTEEQETTLQSHSRNETEVWSLIFVVTAIYLFHEM